MAPAKGKTARKARGFTRAGGLIGAQMRTASARRSFAQARLQALWPDIAGAEIAAISEPVRLSPARGPAGGLLTLAVAGAHGPRLQMLLPTLVDQVNAALGPRVVGRIQLVHAAPGTRPAALQLPSRPPEPAPTPGHFAPALSSIGDEELRGALETLARNVLSRHKRSQTTDTS